MKILEQNYDKRSDCLSILTSMTLKEYKGIAYDSFNQGGNLEGQRDVIKRSSVASKIRRRMHSDFVNGAIFPHVVIGLLLNSDDFERTKNDEEFFKSFTIDNNKISIIDGMQRSNIYFSNYENNEERRIRVEFWIANKTIKLLYRMLVLNTGQVPWNTRRQVEVIYANLSQSISERISAQYPELDDKVEITGVDEDRRRSQPGIFKKSLMIELYLGYNTRKVKVDVNDELADEFQRFDMMESVENDKNFDYFIDAFAALCKLDFAFSECENSNNDSGQYKAGKDIFGSIPACIGFIVACAEYVMGKVTVNRNDEKKEEKNINMKKQIEKIIQLISQNKDKDFLALDSLNTIISSQTGNKSNRIGDEMRSIFKNIFSEMLRYEEIEEVESLEAFWR